MRFLLSSILVSSLVSFSTVAFAQSIPVTPIPPSAPRATSVPVVVAVDADTITVQNGIHAGMKVTHHEETDQKNKTAANIRKYTVNKFTEITINGHKSSLSAIKPGMQVRVTAGTTPSEASIIAVKVDRSVMIPIP